MESTLIVGSGISGLILARRLQNQGGAGSVLVIEKSRGVGGRLATRRTNTAVFDHGAQFYHLEPAVEPWHSQWLKAEIVSEWGSSKSGEKFVGRKGMTSLAKSLATGLTILLETKAMALEHDGTQWAVHTETGKALKAHQIILTCPLPQSIEILRASELPVHPTLETTSYAKAVVLLLENAESTQWRASDYALLDLNSLGIQMIADQQAKGVSSAPAWTVIMNTAFSEHFFTRTDDELLAEAESRLRQLDPSLKYSKCQLKKWRFSHPLKTLPMPFHSPKPNVYLCGDAFGGPSINGAITSAETLYQHLSE